MNKIKKKSQWLFYQILGLGLSFLILFLFLSFKLYSKLFLMGRAFFGKLETLCSCSNYLSFFNHPFLFSFLILLGLISLLFFSFLVIKIIKLTKTTKRFIKINLGNKKFNQSLKLKKIIQTLELKNQIIEIISPWPLVFCFGWLNPKICVSSKLIQKLSKKELMAVLLHEKYHLLSFQPLKLFLIKIIEKVLFFIPAIKTLTQQYLIFSELMADDYAIKGFSNKTPLVRALSKIIREDKLFVLNNNLTISSFSLVTKERINKLIDDNYLPPFKIHSFKLLVTFLSLVLFSSSLIFSLYFTQPLTSDYHSDFCFFESAEVGQQCATALTQPTCNLRYSLASNHCHF